MKKNARTLSAIGVITGCTLGSLVSVTPVINGTFGMFLVPVTHALGWSRADFSAVLLIMAIVGVVGYPIAGRLADRYGVRPVALIGNALFGICVAALAFSTSQRPLVYTLYAVTGLTATFSSVVVLLKPIPLWFTHHRSMLFAITSAFGINIGIAVLPFFVAAIIAADGWRTAYVGLGAFTVVIGFPSIMLLKNPPVGAIGTDTLETPLPGLKVHEAHRQPVFWLLMFSIALGAGSLSAMLTHMVPLLTDRGIPVTNAAAVFATTALCNASWQIVVGIMLDRTNSPRFAGIFLIMAIIGLGLIGFGTGYWLMVGAVLVGMGSGTEFGLLPCVIPRYFGVKSFSEVYGTIFGVSILASGFMPLFMGLSFDRNGNYNFGLILIATALICSAALIFLMPSFNSKSSPSISATESTSDREAERDQEVGAPNAHLMLVR